MRAGLIRHKLKIVYTVHREQTVLTCIEYWDYYWMPCKRTDTPLPKETVMVQSIVCAQTTVQKPDGVVLGLAKSIVIIVCVQKLSVI